MPTYERCDFCSCTVHELAPGRLVGRYLKHVDTQYCDLMKARKARKLEHESVILPSGKEYKVSTAVMEKKQDLDEITAYAASYNGVVESQDFDDELAQEFLKPLPSSGSPQLTRWRSDYEKMLNKAYLIGHRDD